MRWLLGFALLFFCSISNAEPLEQLEYSVLIKNGVSTGTGVAFKNKDHTFIWTDAHILYGTQSTDTYTEADGTNSQLISYKDVWAIQPIVEDGRKVGENRRLARIIRYAEVEDIALLHVYQKNWLRKGATFAEPNEIPDSGNAIWHVGSFEGDMGESSVSEGVVANVGRLRRNYVQEELDRPFVFDQVSVTAHHGSSGGGVFLKKNGKCLGLITDYLHDDKHTPGSFCITPARRLHQFAIKNDCVWALSHGIDSPADESIKVLTIGAVKTTTITRIKVGDPFLAPAPPDLEVKSQPIPKKKPAPTPKEIFPNVIFEIFKAIPNE